MNRQTYFTVIIIFMFSAAYMNGQEAEIVAQWSFENSADESISGSEFEITGLAKFVPGVKGSAIKFDGFSSFVEGSFFAEDMEEEEDEDEDEEEEFGLPRALSIETWISIGAYPWNWAPILTIGKYKVTGFYFGIDSRGCPGFHVSDATSVWHECNAAVDPETKAGMELHQWYHVVGTYDPREGLAIYVNGELAGTYNDFEFDYGIAYSNLDEGFRMGMNRVELPPSDPIRDWATYPSRYSLDGIVDELKIHNMALDADEVKKLYTSTKPENQPLFEARNFPGVESSGRFGANYTTLEYYPEWDALWPSGEHLDVVVQFDDMPIKTMFWRGTRYSACWVTENGKWMADQSRETGSNWFLGEGSRDDMPTGCIEHMSDVQCRSSRVSIIESNEARVVVNWRYLQMDVKFRQLDLPNNTGFGEWGNELYYIYPDGAGVRKVLPGRGGWQETILLNEPGTRPEDNIELDACKLLNLEGESKSYTWEHGYPEFDLEDAVIQVINLKSEYKPFLIFREGGGFEVFNLEVRPEYSHFPWWNHWPVAQVISDGRSAFAPDRAAHSSLSWGDPNGEAALYGMTNQGDEHVLALARSWNNPPALNADGSSFKSLGYDYTQRAYMLESGDEETALEFTLEGSTRSPVYNPAFVIANWQGGDVQLFVNGKEVKEGKGFRQGLEYQVDGSADLVVWVELSREKPVQFKLTN